jgi:hypothetical protein
MSNSVLRSHLPPAMVHVISVGQTFVSLGGPVMPIGVLDVATHVNHSGLHIHQLEVANPEICMSLVLPVDKFGQEWEMIRC